MRGRTFSRQLKIHGPMPAFWRRDRQARKTRSRRSPEIRPEPHGTETREAALLRVLLQPFLQGPEGLRAAGEEDVAEPIEIDAKVTKSGGRIVGEAWIFGLCRDSFERPDTSNEVFVGQRLLPEVVPDEAERATNVELEAPVAASKLADRRPATAAVIVVVHGAEHEAGRAKHLCQLRRASVEHSRGLHRHRPSMARQRGAMFALAQPIVSRSLRRSRSPSAAPAT